jgi:hypothetical protein
MKAAAVRPTVPRPRAAPRHPVEGGRSLVARLTDPARHAEVGVVLGLCGAALAIRAIAMWLTVDVPGDGPTHATQAYEWSRRPFLVTHGVWLPGFTYWAGVAMWLLDKPLLAPRLLNLGFGTLTIPALYALARRVFGPPVALISAATLVVFPLHVGLSVSSLTEPSFLFFAIAGLTALAWATAGSDADPIALGLFLVCFSLAETIRYEAWPLVPLMLAYVSVRLRAPAVVILAAALLLAFPAAWSAGNYRAFHDPLYGLRLGTRPLEGGGAVNVSTAIANVARQATNHVGWPLSVAALGGLIGEFSRAVRRTISAERAGYAILVTAVWMLIVAGARSVGPALYDRYLLFGYVLVLPYATVLYLRYCGRYRHCIAIGVLVSLASVTAAYGLHRPPIWVTRTQPTEIVEVAHWLPSSRYQNDAVLMTKMEWQSTYLPLYLPQLSGRYFIVSVWAGDETLQRFVHDRRPSLLITQAGDASYRARVERILGRAITADSRVYSVGGVEAYDLSMLLPQGG